MIEPDLVGADPRVCPNRGSMKVDTLVYSYI